MASVMSSKSPIVATNDIPLHRPRILARSAANSSSYKKLIMFMPQHMLYEHVNYMYVHNLNLLGLGTMLTV